MLASWKGASHVDRDPLRAAEDEEGGGTGSGTAPLAAAAMPVAGHPDAALAVGPRLLNGSGAPVGLLRPRAPPLQRANGTGAPRVGPRCYSRSL